MDDVTRYSTRKEVEDSCRAMIASYTSDKMTYEQYSGNGDSEKQGWAEQAKMTAPELEEYLVTSLNQIFKQPFEFEFEWMQVIPPDKNGKLRMIVCEV